MFASMSHTICPDEGCERSFVDQDVLDRHATTVHGAQDYAMSAKQRDKHAAAGVAMADKSFPIPNVEFLKKAIRAFGRAEESRKPAVKAHIKRRARALGAEKLIPDGW